MEIVFIDVVGSWMVSTGGRPPSQSSWPVVGLLSAINMSEFLLSFRVLAALAITETSDRLCQNQQRN